MALPASQKKKKSNLKEIDYFPEVNPFEDMDVEGLFDEAVSTPTREANSSNSSNI